MIRPKKFKKVVRPDGIKFIPVIYNHLFVSIDFQFTIKQTAPHLRATISFSEGVRKTSVQVSEEAGKVRAKERTYVRY
ncbi:MAG: hypothetical protein A2007_03920 [Verrucomicrobia bacterium GWC2_42_7]|nr:MAG: hypothetical protein A2007_03920 [Verrucomicrobia bacterium GWC2_42_7]